MLLPTACALTNNNISINLQLLTIPCDSGQRSTNTSVQVRQGHIQVFTTARIKAKVFRDEPSQYIRQMDAQNSGLCLHIECRRSESYIHVLADYLGGKRIRRIYSSDYDRSRGIRLIDVSRLDMNPVTMTTGR